MLRVLSDEQREREREGEGREFAERWARLKLNNNFGVHGA